MKILHSTWQSPGLDRRNLTTEAHRRKKAKSKNFHHQTFFFVDVENSPRSQHNSIIMGNDGVFELLIHPDGLKDILIPRLQTRYISIYSFLTHRPLSTSSPSPLHPPPPFPSISVAFHVHKHSTLNSYFPQCYPYNASSLPLRPDKSIQTLLETSSVDKR